MEVQGFQKYKSATDQAADLSQFLVCDLLATPGLRSSGHEWVEDYSPGTPIPPANDFRMYRSPADLRSSICRQTEQLPVHLIDEHIFVWLITYQ